MGTIEYMPIVRTNCTKDECKHFKECYATFTNYAKKFVPNLRLLSCILPETTAYKLEIGCESFEKVGKKK